MTEPKRIGLTADRFVDTMLELIAAEGGSLNVNLRQISRRLGCAHTNLYNYFASYEDLRWATFRRTLRLYGEHLERDLDDSLAAGEYLCRVLSNLATFPEEHPGLYRFIGSDPIDLDRIPDDILETVSGMKEWLADIFRIASGPGTSADEAKSASNIVLAYLDGETLNLINGRSVPGESIRGRMVGNALRMFELLTEGSTECSSTEDYRTTPRYPELPLPDTQIGA